MTNETTTPELVLQTQYMDFHITCRKTKTVVVTVTNRSSGARLGRIFWYGPWRQYTFGPEPETVFNTACMDTIIWFIKDLMAKRKESKDGH